MNKLVALLILPLIASIYAAAPTIYMFVGAISKINAAFPG